MCYAVIRISYRNGTEPVTLKEVQSPEELTKLIDELKTRDGVRKVITFVPYLSCELVSEWRDTFHDNSP